MKNEKELGIDTTGLAAQKVINKQPDFLYDKNSQNPYVGRGGKKIIVYNGCVIDGYRYEVQSRAYQLSPEITLVKVIKTYDIHRYGDPPFYFKDGDFWVVDIERARFVDKQKVSDLSKLESYRTFEEFFFVRRGNKWRKVNLKNKRVYSIIEAVQILQNLQ